MFQNIPKITKNLLVINILAYIATLVMRTKDIDLALWGGLHFFASPYFEIYQFITYQFLHGSFTHLFFNMFALWMFGRVIEQVLGPKKFLIYYLLCGVGAGLCQEVVQFFMGSFSLTIGASGAVYGILMAYAMTFPDERLFIFPFPFPIRAKWFIAIFIGVELYSAANAGSDGVAHMAHLGGLLFGFLLMRYWHKNPSSDFTIDGGQEFFKTIKDKFNQQYGNTNMHVHHTDFKETPRTNSREADMEYNARKAKRQAEVDAILDKIRKSGYDSLSKEEKKRLFEASKEDL